MGILTGYLGTYRSAQSRGIYRFTFDDETGALTEPELYYEAPDAKYLALRDGLLAAPVQRGEWAGLCVVDTRVADAPRAVETFRETVTACHVLFDGGRLYTANFHEGTLLSFRVEGGVPVYEQRVEVVPAAGCHQVLACGRYLLVPCMLLDEVRLFDRENHLAPAGAISFPKGSGPRHGVFDGARTRLFVACQTDNTLHAFVARPGGTFEQAGAVPIFPEGAPAGAEAAAVRLSEDERFLYVSVRGADLIAVFRLDGTRAELVQRVSCGGRQPRDILLAPGGRFLLTANRYSNDLAAFRLDPATGLVGGECARVTAYEGVSLLLEAPEKENQSASGE